MKLSRKILGFAVAMTLVATQFTTAFAGAPTQYDNADGTYDGTDGNVAILARSYNSVVVPTTIKVALNPNAYEIVVRYHDVTPAATGTTAAAGTTYYIKNLSGKYEKYTGTVTAGTTDLFTLASGLDNTKYEQKVYQADTVTGKQVVSLNYGMINKSTSEKIVKIDFKIGYTEKANTTNTNELTFVGTALAADAKSNSNPTGADKNEAKMFLQVQSADATNKVKVRETLTRVLTYDSATAADKPIASTAVLAADVPVWKVVKDGSGNITGYSLLGANEGASKIADAPTFATTLADNKGDLFIKKSDAPGNTGYDVTPETTAAQLSDAVITPVATGTDSPRTFATGAVTKSGTSVTDAANCSVAYSLLPASYEKYANSVIDLDTTQSELAASVYCDEINGFAGFTFAGSMNPATNCDWTRANTTGITITPKYTIRDPKSTTEATKINGTSSQVNLATTVTFTGAGVITIDNLPANTTVTGATISYTKGGVAKNDNIFDASGVTWNASYTSATLDTEWTDWLAGAGAVNLTITFSDSTSIQATANF
jgi:hypothetical protein